MQEQHGVTLLESEMQEIEDIVLKNLAKEKLIEVHQMQEYVASASERLEVLKQIQSVAEEKRKRLQALISQTKNRYPNA